MVSAINVTNAITMNIPINFNDFTTERNFIYLQYKFYQIDYNFSPGDDKQLDKVLNNPTIQLEMEDFTTGERYLVEKKFEDDFLIDRIKKLSDKNYKRFYAEASKLYLKELKQGYYDDKLVKIRETTETISKATFLNEEIISLLLFQLSDLEDRVVDMSTNPIPQVKYKIQFKWRKNDVLYLFHLLRENDMINTISDADLGRILDSVLEYREKDGDFVELKRSRKFLGGFRRNTTSDSKIVERLKNIFNEDFFNV